MKLLAIDGNSILNRAFYGIRLLSTKDGVYTNAVFGFMNILLKLKDEFKPDKIAVAFDLKAPTFRHREYAEYKAGRKPMPDELRPQFPIIKELLKNYGCAVLELEGYEADDILGTLSDIYTGADSCIIATGDRDALQLVTDNVSVVLTATKAGHPETTVYTPKEVIGKYSVTPLELIDVKALMGDSSDNIPGVAGIGEKTACKLISEYHSLDEIYKDVDALDITKGVKEKLKNGKDSAFLSRWLGTIFKQVPIEKSMVENTVADLPALKSQLISLEMFKIADRLKLDDVEVAPNNLSQKQIDITVMEDDEADIDNCAIFMQDDVLCALSDDIAYIIKSGIKEKIALAEHLTVYGAKNLYHEIKAEHCADIECDVELCAYLCAPDQSDYSLDRLCAKYDVSLNVYDGEYSDIISNTYKIASLKPILMNEIEKNGQVNLLTDVEIPLAFTLYSMECDGVLIDREGIKKFGNELETEIAELQQKVYDIVGYEFNLNSPKQLGVALFEKLGLPHGKKTKTGYSTNAEVLEKLRFESEAVEYLLRYRTIAKLKSTYCDGLLKVVSDDNRVRSTFKQTETRTGRLSSTEPNIQNIPVRTPLGRQMRRYFTAKDGCVLVDADYSQIELRVLAHIANDDIMKQAFLSGTDIHTVTASQVFGLPEEMITPELRSRAKAVNFGIVYGIGAFSLSKDINVSVAEAKRYIDGYLATYSGVNNYMKNVVDSAKADGFVTTSFGRRRYLPELTMSNHNMRAFGERVARNMPIQGTAADIIKIAMNKVAQRLENENLKARLILQVHDELICEAPENERETVEQILKEEMESAVAFSVPLTVEVKSGKTWFDTK